MIWVLIGLAALVAVAVLLWPLLRAPVVAQDRAAYNVAVFQDQLKEVDRDLERGVLTTAEADAARIEIQRRIIAAGKVAQGEIRTDSPLRRKLTAGGIAVVVPALAMAAYLSVGQPLVPASEPGTGTAGHDDNEAQIARMVTELAAKVAANPNDAQGLTLLARTYRQLGRFDEAVATYKKLTALQPDGDTFAGLGEAMTAAAGGAVTPEAHGAFVKSLGFDRNEPRAQFYLGLEFALKGDAKTAIAIWRNLAASSPPEAPWVPVVREEMTKVAQAAGIPPMSVTPQHPLDILPTDGTVVAAAPPPAAAADPGGFTDEQRQMIEGMVGGLAARLEQNPADFEGWMMLGKSYTVLRKPEDAAKAYEKAMALKPAEIQPKLQYAALIVTSSTGPVPAGAAKALKDALALDPKNGEALYLTGLAAVRAGDTALARKSFEQVPDGSPLKAEAAKQLQGLK